MTAETWKIQVSPRVGDALINLRAETGEEMLNILSWYETNATTIASAIQGSQAGATVAASFPGSQNVPAQQGSWGDQGSQQAPPAFVPQQAAPQGGPGAPPPTKWDLSGPPSPAPGCAHGSMEWRHRTAKSGKEYKGWFCPSKVQGQQCEAQFLR